MKIIPVDCHYVKAEFATSYLLVHEGRGFFVECNTNYAIPYLVKAAHLAGLKTDEIDGLLITHVHLDHAGGAGLFLKEFPNATLYAHPKAAKHAIDPSRLIASATKVYGEVFMQKQYGTILPCDAIRVHALNDGEAILWKGVNLATKHTSGHANHHLCMIEPITRVLFSGDAFGVSYPELNKKSGLRIIASTSPTDFDGEAAIKVVEWVSDLAKKKMITRVALTHFGILNEDQIEAATNQLIAYLKFSIELVQKVKTENWDEAKLVSEIRNAVQKGMGGASPLLEKEALNCFEIDMKVNAQGLVFVGLK